MILLAAAVGTYVGVASCVNSGCHGSTQPLRATHVLQNEYYTWLNADRHAQAYNVLFDDRSARIVRNMRMHKRAYEEPVCLQCHSTFVASERVSGRIDLEDGVQCEACHGPAGGWRNEHARAGWTHAQSVARGMTDLREVPDRASVCLACHLGDAKREVTHELIASGHPLLQFELDNYTESMPPHWTPDRATHGVRAWAVGEVAAFEQTLDNLARHARNAQWPEFSDLSCSDCHHSLAASQWRQERGWRDRAGLPAWNDQQWPVIRFLAGRAQRDLQQQVNQLEASVSRLRDPASVANAADDLRRTARPLIADVARMDWGGSEVRDAMRKLASVDDLLDVNAAEQIALSLQALAASLTRRDARLLHGPMTTAIDALFAEVQNRDAYDPRRFAAKLHAFRATL